MDRVFRERDLRPRKLDVVLVLVAAAVVIGTGLILSDEELSLVVFDRSLDVAINSLAVLASFSLAALALVRYREGGRVAGLFQSSAFLLLAVIGSINVALVLFKIDGRVGLTLGLPEQWPLYVWSFTQLLAAALLLGGGLATLRSVRTVSWSVRRVLLAPLFATILLSILAYAANNLLPPFIDPSGIQLLIENRVLTGYLEGVTPLAMGIHAAGALLFLGAAWTYRVSFLRNGPVADAYLAAGLVVAGFAEIHAALYPGVYTQLASSADGLRLVSFLVLVLGVDAEARADLRALRAAYAALDRLRVSEAERAALEERTRLAREIHDGLAQDLWFAKLKHERLAPLVPEEARGLSTEVTQALDAAIAEAKHAVVTMRSGLDQDLPLPELLSRLVEDFGARSGLRVELSSSPTLAALAPRRQAELLRVVQEALTNVSKHADATVVRVRATVDDGDLVIRVIDNGRGFLVDEAAQGDGMGLRGMVERARLMGGTLRIASEPSDGTVVRLRVPISEPEPAQLVESPDNVTPIGLPDALAR